MRTNESPIVTFYSYKGGVGRTMAMANVACILANQYGKKVLLVDWDLEAPGLHRFFGLNPKELKPGLIDILNDYKKLLTENTTALPKQLIDIEKYITRRKMPSYTSGGSVSLIAAGHQDDQYATRVNEFSWDEFYKKWHGFGFVEHLKAELKKSADIVLLDSRTGVTDIGGICTLQLPDVVVLMFALNEQNISGVEGIAKSILERATQLAKREKPPALVVRPSRVEIYLEEKSLKKWQQEASERLGRYVPEREGSALRYMSKQGIPYIGAYSFGETPLAVDSNELGPLTEAFESLSRSVVEATEPIKNDVMYRRRNRTLFDLINIWRKYLLNILRLRASTFAAIFILITFSTVGAQYFLYKTRVLNDRNSLLQSEVTRAQKDAQDAQIRATEAEARAKEAQDQARQAQEQLLRLLPKNRRTRLLSSFRRMMRPHDATLAQWHPFP